MPPSLHTAVQLHYSQIPNIPPFPASKHTLVRLLLLRVPSSSTSAAHLRCLLRHFLLPLRRVSSTGLCFGTLLAVKDYGCCVTSTPCSLPPFCIFLKSQDSPSLAHLSALLLFQLPSKWLLVPFMNTDAKRYSATGSITTHQGHLR